MQQLHATSGAHQQRLATNRRTGLRISAAPTRGALARPASIASLPRATSGRRPAQRLAPHQQPPRVSQQHQPSVACATSARHSVTKRATALARARGEGAPPCAAVPMPE
ncbi:late elongated hypocotyl and circadian clock associated-1-like protein 1 [Dorcoceras hygrometricum]|uniref:Late elongated hypocotyl and circadian clock associated-1-like protein 1 n=1 Tax=Dorcoceras hygrometricum TaxID=472368 RepID=A0A2Z6ZTK5_9LAMI|nr:late elongated hypocotyl and circadian clock associated-1-like protein 1 [Dorcoceras hygrometricum]